MGGGHPCCCATTAGECDDCVDGAPGAVQITLSGITNTTGYACTPSCTTLNGTYVLPVTTGTSCRWDLATTGISCVDTPLTAPCPNSFASHTARLLTPASTANKFDIQYRLEKPAVGACVRGDVNYFRSGWGQTSDPNSATCTNWSSVSLAFKSSLSSLPIKCNLSAATCTITSL